MDIYLNTHNGRYSTSKYCVVPVRRGDRPGVWSETWWVSGHEKVTVEYTTEEFEEFSKKTSHPGLFMNKKFEAIGMINLSISEKMIPPERYDRVAEVLAERAKPRVMEDKYPDEYLFEYIIECEAKKLGEMGMATGGLPFSYQKKLFELLLKLKGYEDREIEKWQTYNKDGVKVDVFE